MQERSSAAEAKGKAPAKPEKLASALLVDRPQPGVAVLTLNRPEAATRCRSRPSPSCTSP